LPFRDRERHLRDILESIELIDQFLRGMDFSAYERDEKTRAAVERKMQILTEAVIRLEMEARRVSRDRLEGVPRHGQLSQALVRSSLGRNRLEHCAGRFASFKTDRGKGSQQFKFTISKPRNGLWVGAPA
jgi:Protein of unknown function DUF86